MEFAVGVVGMASFAAAAVLWRVTADDAPPRWWDANGLVDGVAFLCSVAWIAAAARERRSASPRSGTFSALPRRRSR